MASGTPRSCYCCDESSSIDVDSALSELGMLSTVTDSTRQYQRELKRHGRAENSMRFSVRIGSMSNPYPLVRMNRQYVGNISFNPAANVTHSDVNNRASTSEDSTNRAPSIDTVQSRASTDESLHNALNTNKSTMTIKDLINLSGFHPIPSTSAQASWPGIYEDVLLGSCERGRRSSDRSHDFANYFHNPDIELEARARRLARFRLSRIRKFRRPYELSWQRLLYPPNSLATVFTRSLCSPVSSRCRLSVSKSNNSSPVKGEQLPDSFSSPESLDSGVTLVRSRSFDDLDFSRLKLNDADTHHRRHSIHQHDVDTMSQTLDRLDVSH